MKKEKETKKEEKEEKKCIEIGEVHVKKPTKRGRKTFEELHTPTAEEQEAVWGKELWAFIQSYADDEKEEECNGTLSGQNG